MHLLLDFAPVWGAICAKNQSIATFVMMAPHIRTWPYSGGDITEPL